MHHISDLVFAMQKALLGVVTPELRAVIVDLEENKKVFYIRFYFHRETSDSMIRLWNSAVAGAVTELDPSYSLDLDIERLDYPQKFPVRGRYAYLRKE